jgi:hypothetical protein
MDKEVVIKQLIEAESKINKAKFRGEEAKRILKEIILVIKTDKIDPEVQSRIALREAQAQKFLADAEQTRAVTKNSIERD